MKLEALKKYRTTNALKKWLLNKAMQEHGEGYVAFLEDIVIHGCDSGVVGEVIYYSDCEVFYKKYELDIEDIINAYLDSMGGTYKDFVFCLKFDTHGQLVCRIVWFTIEQAARELLGA